MALFTKKKKTKKQQAEYIKGLRMDRDRFVAFAFASADMLFEVDMNGVIAFADGATAKMLGKKKVGLEGEYFHGLLSDTDMQNVKSMLFDHGGVYRIDGVRVRMKCRGQKESPFIMNGFRLPDIENHYFITLTQERAQGAGLDMATHDPRTALQRKEAFADGSSKKAVNATRSGEELDMTLVDFPEFAKFLESLPQDRAAVFLEKIGGYMKEHSVDGESAGMIKEGSYSILHDNTKDAETIQGDLSAITKEFDPSGVGLQVKAHTLGMGTGDLTDQDAANALLYTMNKFAEQKGSGFTIASLNESYQHMLEDTVKKIAEFKKTVSDGEFQVAFQPIVDLRSLRLHHYEGLVRLKEGSNFDDPSHFIDFGEQSGIIGEFDLTMVKRTLNMMQERATKNVRPVVAVNLSGKSLTSTMFKDTVRQVLREHQDVASQVMFEITDSMHIQDLDAANRFMQELRRNGNAFCLDNFGAGESSFEYLRRLQVDFVKIDGGYIRESLATKRGRNLLRAIINLCNDMRIVAIGTQIEDENVAKYLAECGMGLGQGYCFGKPEIGVLKLHNCTQLSPMINPDFGNRKTKSQQSRWWSRKAS